MITRPLCSFLLGLGFIPRGEQVEQGKSRPGIYTIQSDGEIAVRPLLP